MSGPLLRTPLHEEHERLGAKLVPFAGFHMPVQYPTGITAEHHAVRRQVGMFDVSHMGELELEGEAALALVQTLTTNDASRLEIGQAQYSALCRDDGGILDDLIVYRLGERRYMLVVNAATRAKDLAWVERHAAGLDLEIRDRSDEIALVAVQGPRAREVVGALTDFDVDEVRYYRFREGKVAGLPALVSATGYTGEDGFEIFVAGEEGALLWRKLHQQGADAGLLPAGLGARDSLRLEVGYALYGNDLDEAHTPLEAGLGWITKLDKGDFVGREALARQKAEGPRQRLTGLRLLERAFPRPGYEVRAGDEVVARLTSGTLSPSLGEGIGLAYLPADLATPGTELEVDVRGRGARARVERPPFYTQGSIRR